MYSDELTKAMTWLGEQPGTVFLGQQVRYLGNGLYKTLEGVPEEKRIELGVAEDMQMGMAIGMAKAGKVPICIYPRMDFLLLAMNQLVNHLDHYRTPMPVLIRTCVGARRPLDPGPQHSGDYTQALERMLPFVSIYTLDHRDKILSSYKHAYENGLMAKPALSAVLVEYGGMY